MDQKINYGIIGILALLAGFGGSTLINQDSFENTYVCTSNENLGVFERLSSTQKTGYYIDPFNASNELSKVCRNGFWISLNDYAQSRGVDPKTFLANKQFTDVVASVAPSEECFPLDQGGECVRIN